MLLRKDRNSRAFFGRRGERATTPSLLSADVKIDGDVIAGGDLFIGGAVKGRVVARQLTVGENAVVTGIVEAEIAVIAGTLTGKITAKVVTIKRTAMVSADITHTSLVIEPGGTFEGFSRHVASTESSMTTIEDGEEAPTTGTVAALSHVG